MLLCVVHSFLERDVRKIYLKKYLADIVIPPFVYLPLCSSLEPFSYVLRVLPKEAHAFSTKARCPALILFEMEERVDGLDYASFLAYDIGEYEEREIFSPDKLSFKATLDKFANTEEPKVVMKEDGTSVVVERFPSKFRRTTSNFMEIWEEEGTGQRRLTSTSTEESGTRFVLLLSFPFSDCEIYLDFIDNSYFQHFKEDLLERFFQQTHQFANLVWKNLVRVPRRH